MIQRPDFWDTVAKNVHVHRNDIEKLEDHRIVLKDGPSIPMDVIICATGFINEYTFFTAEQRATLGLSHSKQESTAEADREVSQGIRNYRHLLTQLQRTRQRARRQIDSTTA
jgi:dimethylaniline monooxygenase (N-oxide forming)